MHVSISNHNSTGYLGQVEASIVGVRPGPGVLFIRMARGVSTEASQTNMFIELTPGEAVSLVQHLQDCIGIALATND